MDQTSVVHYSLGSWGVSAYWTACGLRNIDAWVTKNEQRVTCENCVLALEKDSNRKKK